MHLRPIWWPAIVVLLAVADAQTPVIGGLCKLGSNDVQIGGKQTQFFLKCEERQGSDEKAYGVWVVKSRASPIDEPEPSHPKSIPTTRRRTQATCQQDHEARVGLPCVYGGECLQFNYDDATTYLQCDADSRWIKRICGNNLVFSFHHQACIGDGTNTIPGRVPQPNGGDAAPSYRQAQQSRQYVAQAGGMVCTFSECSVNKPCPQGAECNNGYCCEITSVLPQPVFAAATNVIRNCPDNTPSLQQGCVSDSECPSGYNCPVDVGACCKIAVNFPLPSTDAQAIPVPVQLPAMSAFPNNRRNQFTGSVGCNGCGAQPMPVAAPVAVASSSCTAGCPRGYSGCCGTQQASCCVRQECPGGQMSTGRSCYTSCPSGQSCNAGVCCPSLLTCPTGAQAVGQCINGQCGTGYSCDLSTNLCCPSIGQSNNFICTDGSQAAGACIGGLCGAGFSCVNNLCCRGSSSTLRCLDGTTPLGTCLNGLCPLNYQCSLGNICCGTGAAQTCPSGGTAIGPCTSNLCPVNFVCNTANNQCCPSAAGATCPNNATPLGPCVDGNCPLSFACNTASNQCCPSTVTGTCPAGQVSIGPCISGLCPPGNTCVNNICCSGTGTGTDTCANNAPSIGPCVGGLCPPGNTCVGTVCCAIARLHRAPAIESSPDGVIRRQQPVVDQIGSCPNGQQAIGQCISGLCGAGFTCINNLCCSTTTTGNNINLCPNGQAGVGACFPGGQCGIGFTCDLRTNLCCSPSNGMVGGNSIVITVCQSGSQPLGTCPTGQNTCPSGYACEGTICCRQSGDIVVGGQCQQPQQCAGYPQGLATCVDQTCRCQPVAYVQGIACVRRRMLRLKFNDDGNVDSAEDEERAEEEVVKEESKSS